MAELMRPTTDMSDKHERFVNGALGLTPTRGSGNQAKNPLDGRHTRGEHVFDLGADCKSTLGKSMSVSTAMWDKLVEQAHGLTPILPLRFYGSHDLSTVSHELVVLDFNDFLTMWQMAESS